MSRSAVDALSDACDRLRPGFERLRTAPHERWLRLQTWLRCGRRYAAPISPTAVLDVAPTVITHVIESSRRDALDARSPAHVQTVADGDWDLESPPFVGCPLFRAHREHVVDGVPWAETALRGSADRPAPPMPGRSPSSPLRRVATDGGTGLADALETCYADVATRGYRSVRERRRCNRLAESTAFDPYPGLPPAKGEIRVCIGRDGRFVLHSGHHRLAVARLLGVETVPVHVLVRHSRWQARRDRVVLTGAEAGSHPDLVDLEPRRGLSR